jgi:tRNA(His) guanylyltransferase
VKLKYPPMFDGRVICYPTEEILKDYLSWRQADCHINNLYNTCFWSLVNQGGRSPKEAESDLKGTVSAQKNELLFSRFGINYNNIEAVYRKGTILTQNVAEELEQISEQTGVHFAEIAIKQCGVLALHEDLISAEFWTKYASIFEWKRQHQTKKKKLA